VTGQARLRLRLSARVGVGVDDVTPSRPVFVEVRGYLTSWARVPRMRHDAEPMGS